MKKIAIPFVLLSLLAAVPAMADGSKSEKPAAPASEVVPLGPAHEGLCREAIRRDRPLLDLLAENAEIAKHLDRAALAKLCDPANYLGQCGVMVDRVLAMLQASAGRR